MGSRIRAGRPLVALLLAVGLLAACSSGGSSGERGTDKETTTTVGRGSDDSSTTTTERSSLPIGDDPSDIPAQPSAGCGGYAAPRAGQQRVDLRFETLDRWYLISRPSSVSSDIPAPLVVDLHGYLEGAELHARVSDLATLGEREGFVTLTPQGQGDPVHWVTTIDGPDVRFVEHIVSQVEADTCIDLNRVYATGFSNGAFLSSALACSDSETFAAVAPVAGVRDVPGCQPTRPVPVITFHGTKDTFVTYEGGLGGGAAELPSPDGSDETISDADGDPTGDEILPGSIDDSVPDILATWAKRNGCRGEPRATDITGDVDLLAPSCPDGREVELYLVDGGGHSWPGSTVGATLDQVTGHTTMSIDATKLIWEFFEQHPLRPT